MIPSVLGKVVLDEPILADDGVTEVSEAYVDHFSKRGHDGVVLSVRSTEVGQAALNLLLPPYLKLKKLFQMLILYKMI